MVFHKDGAVARGGAPGATVDLVGSQDRGRAGKDAGHEPAGLGSESAAASVSAALERHRAFPPRRPATAGHGGLSATRRRGPDSAHGFRVRGVESVDGADGAGPCAWLGECAGDDDRRSVSVRAVGDVGGDDSLGGGSGAGGRLESRENHTPSGPCMTLQKFRCETTSVIPNANEHLFPHKEVSVRWTRLVGQFFSRFWMVFQVCFGWLFGVEFLD